LREAAISNRDQESSDRFRRTWQHFCMGENCPQASALSPYASTT
jgi:hypothetical protein